MSLSILVTGVSRGIGNVVAKRLASSGHDIIGTARSPAGIDVPFPVLPLDLSRDESIDGLAKSLNKPIDVLINNAGVATMTPELRREEADIEQLSRAEFAHIMDINVIGTFLLTRALIPNLLLGKRRLIINMTSNLGSITLNTAGHRCAYRCSKAALNMLTRCLNVDLAPRGIACIGLHPGWVRTAMGGEQAEISPERAAEHFCDFFAQITPDMAGGYFDYRGVRLPW